MHISADMSRSSTLRLQIVINIVVLAKLTCLQALYSRATGAAKGVAGLAFMMWMSGSQIHLFSIMMTFQGIYAPIAAILGSGEGKQ